MAGLKLVLVLLVCAAVVAPLAVESVNCGQVLSKLGSCVPYLQKGGAPPPACCGGVKGLNSAAKTTADRQAICNCLKAQSAQLDPNKAAKLPGACGVSIPYPISPSTNCATIK